MYLKGTYPSNRAINDSAEMPFIISDGIGSTEANKRKLIRRHVMLGKNRGKTRKVKRGDHQPAQGDLGYNGDDSTGLSINMRYYHIPPKVGSELSFTQFADSVEPALIKDILKCNRHPVLALHRPKSALLMLTSIAQNKSPLWLKESFILLKDVSILTKRTILIECGSSS